MKEKFIIKGGRKLEGEVEIRGSKNAAAAIIAAVLLTNKECVISNIPLVEDIKNLLSILKEMGVEIEWVGEREVKIKAGEGVDPSKIDFEKFYGIGKDSDGYIREVFDNYQFLDYLGLKGRLLSTSYAPSPSTWAAPSQRSPSRTPSAPASSSRCPRRPDARRRTGL